VLRLGSVYQQSFELERHVMPVLRTLVKQFEETAAFYVRRGNQRLCLYRVDSRHMLRDHVRPGDLRPMDKSAAARVLRAFDGRPYPGADAILEYPIFSQGATDPHVAALAMPVFGLNGALVGALAITGPITRLTAERAKAFREPVREAGRRLTRVLGGLQAHPAEAQRKSATA
jgi:DNA-binding IclR family transcriptional regulator